MDYKESKWLDDHLVSIIQDTSSSSTIEQKIIQLEQRCEAFRLENDKLAQECQSLILFHLNYKENMKKYQICGQCCTQFEQKLDSIEKVLMQFIEENQRIKIFVSYIEKCNQDLEFALEKIKSKSNKITANNLKQPTFGLSVSDLPLSSNCEEQFFNQHTVKVNLRNNLEKELHQAENEHLCLLNEWVKATKKFNSNNSRLNVDFKSF